MEGYASVRRFEGGWSFASHYPCKTSSKHVYVVRFTGAKLPDWDTTEILRQPNFQLSQYSVALNDLVDEIPSGHGFLEGNYPI